VSLDTSIWHNRPTIFVSVPVLPGNKKPPLRPVNPNAATALQLQQVPGIGPSTAHKILKMRTSYGQFKSVDDLRAIKGIGPKRTEKMRKYVTTSRPWRRKRRRTVGQRLQRRPLSRHRTCQRKA
jgi:competence ComEA-like helix-hairpin-helix protein